MVIVFGVVLGFVLTTAVYYYKLKSFKEEISVDYTTFGSELSSLRKKVVSGVALVETDFKAVENAFLNVFKKL